MKEYLRTLDAAQRIFFTVLGSEWIMIEMTLNIRLDTTELVTQSEISIEENMAERDNISGRSDSFHEGAEVKIPVREKRAAPRIGTESTTDWEK